MIKTIIQKGSYRDSVVLMLLTNKISTMQGVKKVSIMMATPSNKEIFKASGLDTRELQEAGSNDMAIVVDIVEEENLIDILTEVEAYLNNKGGKVEVSEKQGANSWEQALSESQDANLAVISIPGEYAAVEADRALEEGLNVFIFSDNVSKEDELHLKQKAHEKGLLVMGPDCGTGIIKGVPIAFTNDVRKGKIGVIGASGTGTQEVTMIIDHLGEGVTNAIGTGGRDLHNEIGGITMLDAIDAMEVDDNTEVVLILSKPPAKEVRDKIVKRLMNYKKPVITLFLGEKPEIHETDFYHAYTLDEAARIAVALCKNEPVKPDTYKVELPKGFDKTDKKSIKGYYSGGTLGAEAAMLLKDTMNLEKELGKQEGYMLNTEGNIIIDLGDDIYTVGKPHPMIDPTKRIECMREAVADSNTGVVLFDLVLGYGSHEDMAGALLPGIKEMMNEAKEAKRKLYFVATICGTKSDYQDYDNQKKQLEQAGILVYDSNKRAVENALHLIGYEYKETQKLIQDKKKHNIENIPARIVPEKIKGLLQNTPKVINIGLRSFTDVLKTFDCQVVQYDWTPPAGGDMKLIKILQFLRGYEFS